MKLNGTFFNFSIEKTCLAILINYVVMIPHETCIEHFAAVLDPFKFSWYLMKLSQIEQVVTRRNQITKHKKINDAVLFFKKMKKS